MMKPPSFRALSFFTGLLLCLSLHAQNSGGGVTVNPRGYVPEVKPGVVKPAVPPVIVHPAAPPSSGGAVLPPGTIVVSPPGAGMPGTAVVPSYPSAWIGPTVIRETRSEPAPAPATSSTATSPTVMPMASLRLVAVVGSLKRFQLSTGVTRPLAEASLGVSVGMLVGYGEGRPLRASGDFFGTPWDGPAFFAQAGDGNSGPFLSHPIMAVNEVSPGPWEFEAGVANQRVGWMRVAVALFQGSSPEADAKPVNLPRGRRAAMREVLHRVTWADKPVAQKSPGLTEDAVFAGGDVTYFGKALATFAEKTMTASPGNERLGIAEWHFHAQELGTILKDCPRLVHESVDGAPLRELRVAAGAKLPSWVRPFDFRTGDTRYAGEVWFLVAGDGLISHWLKR